MIALSQTQFNDLMVALTKIVNQAAKLQLAQNVAMDGQVTMSNLRATHVNLFTVSLSGRQPNSHTSPSNRKRCMADGLLENAQLELQEAVAEYQRLLHAAYAPHAVPDVYFRIKEMVIVYHSHRLSYTNAADEEEHSLSLRLSVKAIIERLNGDAGTHFKLLKEGIVRDNIHSDKCIIDFAHIPKREMEFIFNDTCKYLDTILVGFGLATQPYLAPRVRSFFDPKHCGADFSGQSVVKREPLSLRTEIIGDNVGVIRTSVFH